jgi:hemerythrin
MPLIDWTEKLSVGVPSIDTQHKKLVAMANELYDAMKAGHGKDVLNKTLDGLINYTVTHFKYEEKLFAQTGYAASKPHLKEHEDLTKQVLAIQEKMKAGVSFSQSMQVMEFLKNWLTNHIQGSDKSYTAHMISKGVK